MVECDIFPSYICIDLDGLRNNYLDGEKIHILELILEKYNVLVNNNFDFTFQIK
jgi:hypothetical protein